jgi:hypothetical protein
MRFLVQGSVSHVSELIHYLITFACFNKLIRFDYLGCRHMHHVSGPVGLKWECPATAKPRRS